MAKRRNKRKVFKKSISSTKVESNNSPSNNQSSWNSSKNISTEIAKYINTDKGKIFENNIRKTLENECKWEIAGKREFVYRKIIFAKKIFILTVSKPWKFFRQDNKYQITLKENGECILKKNNENISINEDKKYTIEEGKGIIIGKALKIEMDGFYKINNINFPFNSEEIVILYNFLDKCGNNCDKNKKFNNKNNKRKKPKNHNNDNNKINGDISINILKYDSDKNNNTNKDIKLEMKLSEFKYAVLEIKLSKNRIKEMIEQIKRDKGVMEKIVKEKILYIGFVNSDHIDQKIDEEVKGLNFILIGIKNSHFYGRDVIQNIDWNTVDKVKALTSKIDAIKYTIDVLFKLLTNQYKQNSNYYYLFNKEE